MKARNPTGHQPYGKESHRQHAKSTTEKALLVVLRAASSSHKKECYPCPFEDAMMWRGLGSSCEATRRTHA
jgi:hypothetical protein